MPFRARALRRLSVEFLESRKLLTGVAGPEAITAGCEYSDAAIETDAGVPSGVVGEGEGFIGPGLRLEGKIPGITSALAEGEGPAPILDRAWIAHGFNPTQDWDSFRQNYEPGLNGVYYNQLLSTLEANRVEADAAVTPVLWDSNAGWMQAIGLTIVKGGISAQKWGTDATRVMHSVLDVFIESGLTEARLESIQTSQTIEQQVLDFVQAKSLADQAQTSIYLIGHSRGGEVVARAINNLRSELSSLGVASQLLILDAYGRDWTGVPGALGTESPFPVGEKNDYNILVDLGLDQLLTIGRSVTESIVHDALGQISGDMVFSDDLVPDDIYSPASWKAPPRAGMRNLTLPGANHISVSDAFFRDSVPVRQLFSSTESTMNFGDFFEAAVQAGSNDNADWMQLPLLKEIRGGSAHGLLKQASDIAMLSSAFTGEPESAQRLFSIFGSPDSWLRGMWKVVGNVSVNPTSERIEMVGNASSISQPVALPPGTNKILVEGIQINGAGREGDSLQLFLNGDLIGAVNGQQMLLSDRFEFTVQNDRPRSLVGNLELRYQTIVEESGFAILQISLAEDIPHVEVVTTNEYPEPRIKFSGSEGFQLAADFYLESNGVSGLQVGPEGDLQLQLDSVGAEAVATIPELDSPPHEVLMAFALSDGTPVYSEIAIRSAFQTNIVRPMDTSEDAFVTPLDALIVINYLNTAVAAVRAITPLDARVDVNMDGFATPLDALLIINHLNQQSSRGEGENSRDMAVGADPRVDVVEAIDWDWFQLKKRNLLPYLLD